MIIKSNIVAIFFLILWLIGTTILQIDNSIELLLCYWIYLILNCFILLCTKKDILSPIGLIVFISFYSFGLNMPFFATGQLSLDALKYNELFTGDASINEPTIIMMLIILMVAEVSFVLGYFTRLYKLIPIGYLLHIKNVSSKVNIYSFVLLVIIIVLAGIIRIKFHLGEAGVQPNFQYAGIIQYICYNGVLVLCLFFLAQGMRQSNIYTILGLIAVLGIVLTQVLLSWRGGILHVLIMIFFVFRGNQIQLKHKKFKPLIWMMLLVICAPVFIQYGNSIRSERLGGEKKFAQSASSFIFNVMNRTQGTTRLAVVVNDIHELSVTNDFKFIDLYEKGLSTTRYIDLKLYGVLPNQSHSVGTSGLGGPYIACGLLGVFFAFFLFGALYRASYECLKSTNSNNVFGIVWYSTMSFLLLDTLTENFNLSTVKVIIALAGIMFSLSKLLTKPEYNRDVKFKKV